MNIVERIVKLEKAFARLAARTFIKYAKGSWTPTYIGSTIAGTTTYTTQEGTYVKVGILVVARAVIIWTAATGTGNVRLGGLPFTAASDSSFQPRSNNVTFANGSIDGLLQATLTQARLFSPITNGASTELGIEAAGDLRFTIVYLV